VLLVRTLALHAEGHPDIIWIKPTIENILFMSNMFVKNKLREFIAISGFLLIIIGTIGLLLNEFVWSSSSSRTIIFAIVNFVGLVNLAFSRFGIRKGE
jgi:hypothetical protein